MTKSAGGLPESDQKRGRLDATYAILRIRFAPFTHVPRALRLMKATRVGLMKTLRRRRFGPKFGGYYAL